MTDNAMDLTMIACNKIAMIAARIQRRCLVTDPDYAQILVDADVIEHLIREYQRSMMEKLQTAHVGRSYDAHLGATE